VPANYQLGVTLRVLARRQREMGEDPLPSLRRSAEALERVQRLAPERPQIANALASTLIDAAVADVFRGRDPQEWFARAEPLVHKVVQAEPRNSNFWMTRAKIHVYRSYWEEQRGRDREPSLTLAAASYEQAREIRDSAIARHNLASVYQLLVENAVALGRDPTAHAQKALEHAQRGQQLDAKYYGPLGIEGVVYRLLASRARGAEAASLLAKARAKQLTVLSLDPKLGEAYLELAECALVEAQLLAEQKKPALTVALEGQRQAQRGAELFDETGRAHVLMAELALIEAAALRAGGRDAGPALLKAKQAAERALRHNPQRATALDALARAERQLGNAQQAAALRARALAIKPDLPSPADELQGAEEQR
jgi:hypothetical protein